MLRIHTGLRKWNKKDQYHIILRDMNSLGINQPCLTIANNEVLFEKYRIALKREKYEIDPSYSTFANQYGSLTYVKYRKPLL